MKLLIGGSSSKIFHLKEFATYLKKMGIETMVVLDIEFSDGFPSRKINNWFTKDRKFKKLIKQFNPDVILVDRQRHFALSSIKNNIPLLLHLRGDFWKEMDMAEKTIYKKFPKKNALKKWDQIAKICFENSQIILPICNFLKNRTKEFYPNKNIQVLYQGINPQNWFPEKGITLKHPCIGLVQSANIYEKTMELLLLTKIMKKFPNVSFYWVGDGPYRDSVLPELKKSKNFHWLGSLKYPDKVRQFLTEIDVYALISGIDMSPLTLLEAQLMRKPVIATNIGGVSELMVDEISGYLVKKGDSDDLEKKIKLLIHNEKSIEMGNAGRKFVVENFSWEIIAKKFKNILDEIVVHDSNKLE